MAKLLRLAVVNLARQSGGAPDRKLDVIVCCPQITAQALLQQMIEK